MGKLPENSIHLVVTSPPYNVGLEYENALSLDEYKVFTRAWMEACKRVLVPGGRLAINIANTGRKPYIFLNAMVATVGQELGLIPRGEIIWFKGHAIAAGKCSWGSWRDCKNPQFRDCHEYILVFSKDDYRLEVEGFEKGDSLTGITGSEFAYCSFSVWNITPARCKWHPAVFPEEIPYRIIKFFTRPGMTVLDPFMGSGTTCVVAARTGREYVGIEKEPGYFKKAKVAIRNAKSQTILHDFLEDVRRKQKQEPPKLEQFMEATKQEGG